MKTPAHSIIYTGGGGRLGNQLVRFAHWLAWIRMQRGDIQLINMAFWPFARYFVQWRQGLGCVYPGGAAPVANLTAQVMTALPDWWQRRLELRCQMLVQTVGACLPNSQAIVLRDDIGEAIDLDSSTFIERLKRRRVTFCKGWKIAGWRLFSEQQEELRRDFQPAPQFLQRARDFVTPLRERYDVIAGLFIRQSDYRQWRDGQFYYSSNDYGDWMRQLMDLYPRKRLGIIIASEEVQDPSVFAGMPCHFASGSRNAGGHWFESFTELSLCDFILSPPSTFSASAAFVGNVPLWPLVDVKQVLAFEQLMHDPMVEGSRHPLFSMAVK